MSQQWGQAYSGADVLIEMNAASLQQVTLGVRPVTFRWTWTEPRELQRTPGVSYKSPIEATDFDCTRRMLHTASVTLYDPQGRPIAFDRVVPSTRWDPIEPGSTTTSGECAGDRVSWGNQAHNSTGTDKVSEAWT